MSNYKELVKSQNEEILQNQQVIKNILDKNMPNKEQKEEINKRIEELELKVGNLMNRINKTNEA